MPPLSSLCCCCRPYDLNMFSAYVEEEQDAKNKVKLGSTPRTQIDSIHLASGNVISLKWRISFCLLEIQPSRTSWGRPHTPYAKNHIFLPPPAVAPHTFCGNHPLVYIQII